MGISLGLRMGIDLGLRMGISLGSRMGIDLGLRCAVDPPSPLFVIIIFHYRHRYHDDSYPRTQAAEVNNVQKETVAYFALEDIQQVATKPSLLPVCRVSNTCLHEGPH